MDGRRRSLCVGVVTPLPAAARLLLLLLVLGPAAMVGSACQKSSTTDAPSPLRIFAPSSLEGPLDEVAAVFEGRHSEPSTRRSYAATSQIARQVLGGAPADVVVTADARWMDALEQRGAISPGTRVRLLAGSLVVVVPAASDWIPAGPAELKDATERRIALATEPVPAGRYAQAALERSRAWPLPHPILTANVRGALRLAASQEADAAIVYATDALAEPEVKVAFTFPQTAIRRSYTTPPSSTVALLRARRGRPGCSGFLQGDEAWSIWSRAGFTRP